MGLLPFRFAHERLMDARRPFTPAQHLTAVDARVQDGLDGRVLDARALFDLAVGESLPTKTEAFDDERRVDVRHEESIDEVVAGLGPVDPAPFFHRAVETHAHVL